jgi:archaeal flagellin FlaB
MKTKNNKEQQIFFVIFLIVSAIVAGNLFVSSSNIDHVLKKMPRLDPSKFGLKNNKGETGIGTLIIFIAIVLVAAIAASVLLGTAGSLQQKALTTGKQTQQEVSSGMQVISVSAQNGLDGNVENFEMLVKLSAGSNPLALNDTTINFDTKNSSQSLNYEANASLVTSGQEFIATYSKTGPDYLQNFVSVGDIIKIQFNSTYSIAQSQSVKIKMVPRRGVIVPVEFVTPDVISTQRVSLYP